MNLWILLAVLLFALSAILVFFFKVDMKTAWGLTNAGLAFFALGHALTRPVNVGTS